MKERGKKFFLLLVAVSVIMAVAVFYFVWSGSYISLIRFKQWFIPPGILLILMSLFL